MNKKKLLKLLAQKEARKAQLIAKAEASEDVAEIRSLNKELETINVEIRDLEEIIASTPDDAPEGGGAPEGGAPEGGDPEGRSGSPVGKTQVLGSYGLPGADVPDARKKEINQVYEQRGADLKAKKAITISMEETPEERAVTIASGDLVVQKKYANDLNPAFNEISTLIDQVNGIPLPGGESYTQAFEVSEGEGDYTTETGNYVETDPVTDYVEIGKAKITAYTEITDEATKLPNINYLALVSKNVRNAIRKKITKQIMIGAGGANALVGIFNAPVNVIPVASDIEIAEIDADTLDTIVFGYGGDEDVEGVATLILNKKDLAAFAALRDAVGEKLYDISVNGNTGFITSNGSFKVPYILNSACPQLSAAATASGTYCMAYGALMSYEMPVFSPLTVEESRDYKFRSGQIAFRGSVWAGGNVASYKGFVRIKKK